MATAASIVIHVPHASAVVPSAHRREFALDDGQLEQELIYMTDWYTDELFALADPLACVERFPISRLVVDPERFEDPELEPMESRGMGAVYTSTSHCQPLRLEVTAQHREHLLDSYYRPHHRRLSAAVKRAIDTHGKCLIIDAHSFPFEPLPYEMDQNSDRPQICIGTDSDHTPKWLRDAVVQIYAGLGYMVEVDRPFAGSLVPSDRYRTDTRVMSVMVELNRGLYLDGWSSRKSDDFDDVLMKNLKALREICELFAIGSMGS